MIHCTCTVDTAFIEDLILHTIIPEKGSSSIIRKLQCNNGCFIFMSQMISAEVRTVFCFFVFLSH